MNIYALGQRLSALLVLFLLTAGATLAVAAPPITAMTRVCA
jgi:hypothetical protein